MKPSNWISAAIAAIATAILPGCDTAVLQEIKPGITTAVEVRARMGNPGFEFRNEDGSVVTGHDQIGDLFIQGPSAPLRSSAPRPRHGGRKQ